MTLVSLSIFCPTNLRYLSNLVKALPGMQFCKTLALRSANGTINIQSRHISGVLERGQEVKYPSESVERFDNLIIP
jgi:hypothetical protein